MRWTVKGMFWWQFEQDHFGEDCSGSLKTLRADPSVIVTGFYTCGIQWYYFYQWWYVLLLADVYESSGKIKIANKGLLMRSISLSDDSVRCKFDRAKIGIFLFLNYALDCKMNVLVTSWTRPFWTGLFLSKITLNCKIIFWNCTCK